MGRANQSKYSYIKSGYKFKEWAVLKVTGDLISTKIVHAQCSCGFYKKQKLTDFITRGGKNCNGPEHILGRKYGKLRASKVLYLKKESFGAKRHVFQFVCDCGNKINKTLHQLHHKIKKLRSCGCVPTIRSKRMGPGVANFRSYYSLYRSRAKREKITFKINRAQFLFLTQKPCFYCGKLFTNNFNAYKGYKPFSCNGLDRLNNSKGYSVDNCVPCCHKCNRSKGAISVDMMKKIIEAKPNDYDNAPISGVSRRRLKSVIYIMKSKLKDRLFSISNKNLLSIISSPCHYCGIRQERRIGGYWVKITGVDRLDSSKGYVKGNCLPCCSKCNITKKDFSVESSKKVLKTILHNPYKSKLIKLKNIDDNFKDFKELPFLVG